MNAIARTDGAAVEAIAPLDAKLIESVLIQGDLAKLASGDRLRYYKSVCDSLGLNPLTRPFDYITLNGRMVLYAKRECTEQLRQIHGISTRIMAREVIDDIYVVTAQARDRNGREDESTGAVAIATLKGEAKANALMKAETKAKRRVTLSICGLAFLDETEIGSIPDAVVGENPGWNGSGSKEAAQAVAVEKVAKLEAEAAKQPKQGDFKMWLKSAAMMKQELFIATGNHTAYYRELGGAGYEHANEVKDRKTQIALFKSWGGILQDVKFGVSDADALLESISEK